MCDSLPVEIKHIVEHIAEEKKVANYEVTLNDGNNKGEGYLGELVFLKFQDNDNAKSYDFVIKWAFKNKNVRKVTPIRECFLNEILLYKSVWPTLQALQKQHGISDKLDYVPDCFYSSTEEFNEYLVIENLKVLGYDVYNRMQIVSYEQMEYLFKIFGRLHGLSSVLRKQNNKEFQKISTGLTKAYKKFMESDFLNDMFRSLCRSGRDKLIPGIDDEVIKAYGNYYENGLEIFAATTNYTGNYPVLLHGDSWSNNIMLKFDDNNQIADVKLIDWQMANVSSAVCDLSYLLYSGATKDTFDRLDDLLKVYHDSFAKIAKECNEDVEELYPFEALKAEWKDHACFGLIFSFMLIKTKLTKKEDVVDFIEMSSAEDKEDVSNKYLTSPVCESYDGRLRDLILHAYDIGIL